MLWTCRMGNRCKRTLKEAPRGDCEYMNLGYASETLDKGKYRSHESKYSLTRAYIFSVLFLATQPQQGRHMFLVLMREHSAKVQLQCGSARYFAITRPNLSTSAWGIKIVILNDLGERARTAVCDIASSREVFTRNFFRLRVYFLKSNRYPMACYC
jgi:hypothetical protein